MGGALNAIEGIFQKVLPLVMDFASGNYAGLAADLFKDIAQLSGNQGLQQMAGGLSMATGGFGSLFGNTLSAPPSSIGSSSNPLTSILSALGQGAGMTLPSLLNRAPTIGNWASTIANGAGSYAPQYIAPPPPSGGNWQGDNPAISQAIGGGAFSSALSSQQQQMLNSVTDPTQKAQLTLEFQMQNEQRVTELISTIFKMFKDTAEAVTRNFA
jgi:hypothetical protein